MRRAPASAWAMQKHRLLGFEKTTRQLLVNTWIVLVTGTFIHGLALNLMYGYTGWIADSLWAGVGWALTLAGPLIAKAFLQSLTPAFFLGAFVGGATYTRHKKRRQTNSPVQQGLLAAILVPVFIAALLVLVGPMVLSYSVFQPRHFFSGDFDVITCCDTIADANQASTASPEPGVPWGLAFRERASGRPFVDLCGVASYDDHCLFTQKGLAVDTTNLAKHEFQLTYRYNSVSQLDFNLNGYDEIFFDRRYAFIIGVKKAHSITETLLGLSPSLEMHVFNAASEGGSQVFTSAGTSIHSMEIVERKGKFYMKLQAIDVDGSKTHELQRFQKQIL